MIYMISYDISAPDNNREQVEKDIESIGKYCKFLTTTYLVSTVISIDSVNALAFKHLQGKDRMIICETDDSVSGWITDQQRRELQALLQ